MSLRQLEAIGFTRSDVLRRAQSGSLRRTLPGVYRIAGAGPTLEQRAVAAVLWAGEGAVASHGTAAALWGLTRRAREVHVTTARTITSPPRGLRAHTARLPPRDRGKLRGVAVTSVARTLLDIAAVCPEDRLFSLVERAILEGLVTAGQVDDLLERNRGRRGCRRLARALDAGGTSALERRVAAILQDAGLPAHEREYAVGRFRLDFAWPSALVAVEADGRRWHSSAADFTRDRAKHNLLVDRGWRVLRVTWRDLDDPATWLTPLAQWL